jgi:hypothetical protein
MPLMESLATLSPRSNCVQSLDSFCGTMFHKKAEATKRREEGKFYRRTRPNRLELAFSICGVSSLVWKLANGDAW